MRPIEQDHRKQYQGKVITVLSPTGNSADDVFTYIHRIIYVADDYGVTSSQQVVHRVHEFADPNKQEEWEFVNPIKCDDGIDRYPVKLTNRQTAYITQREAAVGATFLGDTWFETSEFADGHQIGPDNPLYTISLHLAGSDKIPGGLRWVPGTDHHKWIEEPAEEPVDEPVQVKPEVDAEDSEESSQDAAAADEPAQDTETVTDSIRISLYNYQCRAVFDGREAARLLPTEVVTQELAAGQQQGRAGP